MVKPSIVFSIREGKVRLLKFTLRAVKIDRSRVGAADHDTQSLTPNRPVLVG